MLKNLKSKTLKIVTMVITVVMLNSAKVFAITTPDEDEVNDIASKGLKLFFGALAGFAVIKGGFEFYEAFLANKENKEQGGFGGTQNKFKNHIFAGIMCLIAAAVIYIVLRWTQSLFDLA